MELLADSIDGWINVVRSVEDRGGRVVQKSSSRVEKCAARLDLEENVAICG